MSNYTDYTVATVGSHSALEICRGARDEGFKTLVIVEKGRDKTYSEYFKSNQNLGIVDEVLYVEKFNDVISKNIQKRLKEKNSVFIPHRSFEVYVADYDAIEKDFEVPIFGNKKLLRFEERDEKPNQYDILKKGGIKYPKIYKKPQDIDKLVIVKVAEKERGFERAFFLAESAQDFETKSVELIKQERITRDALQSAVIEEFILGAQVNFNFFYSQVNSRLELMGTDTRRQTNLDGLLRLPSVNQEQILEKVQIKYEEAGHIAATVLESLLEPAFDIGEKFIKATKEMVKPGIVGPFALQAVVTPGPPKKEIIVFDVSPRMPGSPGISATPYSTYLYGKPISMGRRLAMELREAIVANRLSEVTT